LEKLERLEIILFNAFAFFIRKSKLMYEEGKGVKQDDLKALKFFQKACDLNSGGGCSNLGVTHAFW
jgi:TPR repeat protein